MEIVITLLCIASVILWIRQLVVGDRVNGLRYRMQSLEKQLQELKGQAAEQNAHAPVQETTPADDALFPPGPQPVPARTKEPLASVQEDVIVLKELTPSQEESPAATLQKDETPTAQPVLTAGRPAAKPSAPDFSPVKLFSWIGGLMLFLGCVFGIKYAVENGLLSPAMRIVCSGGLGLLLTGLGWWIKQEKYRVTAHTLLGSGLAVIYASIYCAHAFYQFIPPALTFILLALTAFATFGAAVGKNAKYVGYLGAIIAFLTPLLIHSQSDAWAALFTYILFINAAAALAAAKRNWNGLLIFTLAFTWLSQAVWLFHSWPAEAYKLNGMSIFFSLYALGAAWLARKRLFNETATTALGIFLCAGIALMLPLAEEFAANTVASVKILGYTLFVNVLILWQTGQKNLPSWFALIGKIMAFFVLFIWSNAHFDTLSPVLLFGAFIVFAAINGGAELVWHKKEKNVSPRPGGFSALYPALLMLPLLSALIGKADLSFGLTVMTLGLFFILMSGAVILALLAGSIAAAAAGIGLTVLVLLATALRIADWNAVQVLWLIWLGFIPALLGGGLFILAKKFKTEAVLPGEGILSGLTALSPFILLLAVMIQGRPSNPHWIFGATLALCALNALAARIYKNAAFLPATLTGAVFVQIVYCGGGNTISPELALPLTGWSAGIFALFFVFPFVLKKYFWQSKSAWFAAAGAGVAQCAFIYMWLKSVTNTAHWGLLPLAFLMIYLPVVKKLWDDRQTDERLTAPLAFVAGAALFFLTVIFPLEMGGKWLTLAWSLEGCALVWLNKRVAYKGLTSTGYGLLAVTFLRLLCLDLEPIPATRLWNWYLGIYGIYAVCALSAAHFWPENTSRFWKKSLAAMGGMMLFFLLNIEIAHWFSVGLPLMFEFTGSVAEALAYTLGWALFGSACMGLGLFYNKTTLGKTGAGIIGLALVKFFLSDIWELEALYRIIGLFALALILIAASFYYQRKRNV